MSKKPWTKTDFRKEFDLLQKKGKISDKKAIDLVGQMLNQIYVLENQVTFLTAKAEEIKNNPVVNAFLKLEERLDNLDRTISDLDKKVERCEDRRHTRDFDGGLH
jgi:uncharacterized protein YdaT